jgi:hypothetical protein
MADIKWHDDYSNIVLMVAWMADSGYTAKDIAHAVEKPWNHEDEFQMAYKAVVAG